MLNQTATITGITAAHKESERLEKKLIETALNEDADLFDRIDSLRQLGSKGGKASIQPLSTLLLGDERLAHMACYAMETNPDPEVNQVLLEALKKAEGRNAMNILHCLGEREVEEAVGEIAKRLNHSDRHLHAIAAGALGRIANENAFAALRGSIRDAEDKRSVYEGILRCANKFEETNKEQARNIYSRLQQIDAPEYVKHGAKLGAERVG